MSARNTKSPPSPLRARRSAELFYWSYVVIFLAAWVVFRFWTPTAMLVRHTYQLPANPGPPPGVLISDRWSWRFVREGLYVLFILGPISGLFMLWTRSRFGWGIHLGVLLLLSVWLVVQLVFDAIDLAYANAAPTDPNWDPDNLATDNRWCCVYGGQPGTQNVCANVAPCTPGSLSANELRYDGTYVLRFAFTLLLFALITVVDTIFTAALWRRALNAWLATLGEQDAASPLEMKLPERSRYTRLLATRKL